MDLPKKITPDSLRESVVEIKYTSSIPFEVIPGILSQQFPDDYRYTVELVQVDTQSVFDRLIQRKFILYNDEVTIQITPLSVIFNCFQGYIGWEKYIEQITKAIRIIYNSKVIESWKSVGLRYISQYKDQDLRLSTNFNYQFGHKEINSDYVGFKSDFTYKDKKVLLNLHNLMPARNDSTPEGTIERISIIDVDVIHENLNLNLEEIDKLIFTIESSHQCEKEIFFGILKPEFINSLNPQY